MERPTVETQTAVGQGWNHGIHHLVNFTLRSGGTLQRAALDNLSGAEGASSGLMERNYGMTQYMEGNKMATCKSCGKEMGVLYGGVCWRCNSTPKKEEKLTVIHMVHSEKKVINGQVVTIETGTDADGHTYRRRVADHEAWETPLCYRQHGAGEVGRNVGGQSYTVHNVSEWVKI